MCFYSDAHDGLLRNKAALIDAHAFGEAFDASLDAMDAWSTVRHANGNKLPMATSFQGDAGMQRALGPTSSSPRLPCPGVCYSLRCGIGEKARCSAFPSGCSLSSQMFGWHFPCCIDQAGGRVQNTTHGDVECKAIAASMALLRWQVRVLL